MKLRMLTILLVLTLASCGEGEMSEQPRYDTYGKSKLFANGMVMQAPPDGTVARDEKTSGDPATERPKMSLALLQRGRERFNIYCTACHGYAGYGHGTVPSRGFPQPPDFHGASLRNAPPSRFVNAITNGYGVMYSYADRVTVADRWAIAAYIKALQLSQDAPVASLTDAERAKLEGGGK